MHPCCCGLMNQTELLRLPAPASFEIPAGASMQCFDNCAWCMIVNAACIVQYRCTQQADIPQPCQVCNTVCTVKPSQVNPIEAHSELRMYHSLQAAQHAHAYKCCQVCMYRVHSSSSLGSVLQLELTCQCQGRATVRADYVVIHAEGACEATCTPIT